MKLKHGLKSLLAVIVLAGIGVLLVWPFIEGHKELAAGQEQERPVKAVSRVSSVQDGESVVSLNQATQIKSGIIVAPLEPISHQQELRAYGIVLQPQDLVDLRSRYFETKTQVEKTQAVLEASRKSYERLKLLHENNQNISDKVLQTAEVTWRSDEANVQAAQEALYALEVTGWQRWGRVLVQWLFDGSPAFDRLIQQEDVLIQITLPPDAHILPIPQTARVQAEDGTLLLAKLVSPSPHTDPRIQGMSFFYLARAQTTGFLPGMNIIAYLPVGPKVQGVVVPASSVIWWQGKAWVYVQREADRFIRHEISTDWPVEMGWFVSENLSTGGQIVVSGAQLLLSEEFRTQIQVGE